ncbi:hypothetical protein PAL_GLEAN10006847 [Pteropus alecto]|uniref:Uncharacterized protein n=1 Tax=Pteropus alecto TaxID=9402 RepID=L5L5P1_PTEAL|nr:hypothetical protein PAL_GLEAN10006847 [Pteropus alecto]
MSPRTRYPSPRSHLETRPSPPRPRHPETLQTPPPALRRCFSPSPTPVTRFGSDLIASHLNLCVDSGHLAFGHAFL